MSMPSHPENDPAKQPHTHSQDVQFSNVGARVPEKVARGVFATGVLVLQGNTEFILDFVLRMNQPHQIVARVVLPFNLIPQMIQALHGNLEQYRRTFGAPPPAMPMPPPPAQPPSIEEIYQSLKMNEDVMVGSYANSLMVVHTAAEFCLEFIANYYPKAVITARVFLAAPQVPVFLNSITQSWNNLQAKIRQQQQQQPPQSPPGPTA